MFNCFYKTFIYYAGCRKFTRYVHCALCLLLFLGYFIFIVAIATLQILKKALLLISASIKKKINSVKIKNLVKIYIYIIIINLWINLINHRFVFALLESGSGLGLAIDDGEYGWKGGWFILQTALLSQIRAVCCYYYFSLV